MVATIALEAIVERRGGSNPFIRTIEGAAKVANRA